MESKIRCHCADDKKCGESIGGKLLDRIEAYVMLNDRDGPRMKLDKMVNKMSPRGSLFSTSPNIKSNAVKNRDLEQHSSSSAEETDKGLFSGENLAFLEELYRQYLEDPDAVDTSWHEVFEEYAAQESAAPNGHGPRFEPRSIFEPVPGTAPADADPVFVDKLEGTTVRTPGRTKGFAASVEAMVRAFRLHGHLIAQIDPLGRDRRTSPPELDPKLYGLTRDDMQAQVAYEPLFGSEKVTIRQLVDRLRALYCDHIGVEYQNIPGSQARRWLRDQIERHDYAELEGDEERRSILKKLIHADAFESFLHTKYVGAKRFSLTGGDALIPMLCALLEEGGSLGAEEFVIGMAHRGRLNVLHNIMGKPAQAMFSEFEQVESPEKYVGSSDVKYHMGYSSDYTTREGKNIHLSLCFNPSHLEFVNPVVLGRVRAKQDRIGGEGVTKRLVPLLLHGDAAFSGQGIVAEALNLARVPGYHVGGTIHVVINNQIGFTTEPEEGRSTTYATDVAKMLEVPIFHVNANDPEACVRVMKLAMRYRQLFGEDVIVDLVCFRQYGHNEGDEPRFTQPVMYSYVDEMDPVRESYAQELIDENVLSEKDVDEMWDQRMDSYGEVFRDVRESPKRKTIDSMEGVWQSYRGGGLSPDSLVESSIDRDKFEALAEQLGEVPEGFNMHRTIRRLMKQRKQVATGDISADWGTAEALAFASLVTRGTAIRMSGQDCIRGTFSHRHAAIYDMEKGTSYWPLRHLSKDQANLEIYNSVLSEAGVVGFEYGYSLDSPDALVIWEAQFGDFVNGAQVIIDQFINSGEAKWKRLSGITMLLPHGYEGQGPEHSSARLERFLQLCSGDNMYVCNLTTPAQYFHVLRRQVVHPARKPLIIMSPKSLLRHKEAVSPVEEFIEHGFEPIIEERRDHIDPSSVRRVLMCSGKVYYDLTAFAEKKEIDDVAIVRVEQLHPLDKRSLKAAVEPYPDDAELVWMQEEPQNMGAWHYLFPLLIDIFGVDPLPQYIGRPASASPATGAYASHQLEQSTVVAAAFADTLPDVDDLPGR